MVIEEILPRGLVASECLGDVPEDTLYPSERSVVQQAVPTRRREFATGRACARSALARLGIPAQAIGSGQSGSPVWPPGVVGSITHCEGYRGSAVARTSEFLTVGIDAEPNEPLPRHLLPDIAVKSELEWLRGERGSTSSVCWDRLLFCMKEAVYKAWFPLAHRWLGFQDAAITIDLEAGTFSASLLVDGPEVDGVVLRSFDGRWLSKGGFVFAVIALPSPASSRI
jgi:4'-phosphopantetheinyl transferase EntD